MKKMFYIGAALLTGAMGLTAFYAEKPEDVIASRVQIKVDEFNAAKQAECDASVLAAATIKADSIIAAMPVAKPGKPGLVAKPGTKKPATKPATTGTKGGTSSGSPVTPTPPVTPAKDPKKDKMDATQGKVPVSSTEKKADKMGAAQGTVPASSTQSKKDKMKAATGNGGGGM